jgi:signal transduction histidine kinase
VFDTCRNEIARLGFRGGLSLLDETGEYLVIKATVQPAWMVKTLADLEKHMGYTSEGYSFPYTRVSVYCEVIETRKAVFVPDSSSTISEILPGAIQPAVEIITQAIGTLPGIYAPLNTQERAIGVLNIMGSELTQEDVPAVEAFANLIAIALENARLFNELQMELAEHRNLIEELENKNAELERFTYTVSHDLKSPLVTIKGFLGYIEQDAVMGNIDRLKGDIRRISDAVEKMGQLLKGLLELSRIGRFIKPAELISFEELACEPIGLLNGSIGERGITLELQSNLPAVYGDRQRLVEALQNLLENAVQYMGAQSKPRIDVGQHGEEDGKPIFFVKDNGIGIAPEYHELVFGLFNKLDPKGEGTGIGLTLVKRIIEFHGGRIWVESEAGKGSTFYFTLPVKQGENEYSATS